MSHVSHIPSSIKVLSEEIKDFQNEQTFQN